ncbi:unnamed protein product [Paramecium pentaurelia]|uniref:Uncharacterized protein n=1 Tax=Paramecium pentaurelia TaxID=43138 RepID=A0A8S1WLD1_9CILI|nr:unnamed protein product [Paramecium pentaurelia]
MEKVVSKKAIQNLAFKEYQTIYSQVLPIFKKYQQEIDNSDDDSYNNKEQEEDKRLIFDHINQLIDCLKSGIELSLGQSFYIIQNYHPFGKDQVIHIDHKYEQILILIYQDNNQQCNRYLLKFLRLYQKTQKFKNKVRFFVLSKHKLNNYELFFLKNQGIEQIIEFYFPKKNSSNYESIISQKSIKIMSKQIE